MIVSVEWNARTLKNRGVCHSCGENRVIVRGRLSPRAKGVYTENNSKIHCSNCEQVVGRLRKQKGESA